MTTTIPSDLDCIIRVATKAVAQTEDTPESERMCCRTLLRMALPLLEQARLAEDISAIRNAESRAAAIVIRGRVIDAAMRGDRSRADWDAVCAAVTERWGQGVIGQEQSGVCRTGD